LLGRPSERDYIYAALPPHLDEAPLGEPSDRLMHRAFGQIEVLDYISP